MNIIKYLSKVIMLISVLLVWGCGVDRNAAKYDERRYQELQRANCTEMASVLSSKLIAKTPENYDQAMKRCQDLKSLSYEEYIRYAEASRKSGNWDLYATYPEKRLKHNEEPAH